MQFNWIIKRVWPIQEVGEKKHKKRDFVVEEKEGQYPNSICFCLFWEDKVGAIKEENLGSECDVEYNAKTSEYKERYFTNLNVWKVNVLWPMKEGLVDDVVNDVDCDLPF